MIQAGDGPHDEESGTSESKSSVDVDELAEGLLEGSGHLLLRQGVPHTEFGRQELDSRGRELSDSTTSSSGVRKRQHQESSLMTEPMTVGEREILNQSRAEHQKNEADSLHNTSTAVASSIDPQGRCEHPTYWGGLCVVCGTPRPDAECKPC
jgi:hypothetical protein